MEPLFKVVLSGWVLISLPLSPPSLLFSLSLALSLPLLSLCLALSASFSASLALSLCLCVCLSTPLSLCPSLCLTPLSLSLSLPPSLSTLDPPPPCRSEGTRDRDRRLAADWRGGVGGVDGVNVDIRDPRCGRE